MLIFKTKTIILLNWFNYIFYPTTNILDKLSLTYIFSKYKEVFPCQVDHQQDEMIKNNIISSKWICFKCMYNASLKKLKKEEMMVKSVLKIKSLDYHETFSHVIKMNVFMNHICTGNGFVGFWNLDQIPMMIIMEVGKNETYIRSNNMVVNLMIMKTFFMEFQT